MAWQTYKYATRYSAVLSAPSPICWRFSTQSGTLIESEIIDMFGFEWNEKEKTVSPFSAKTQIHI